MGASNGQLWAFNGESLRWAIQCPVVSYIDHREVIVRIARRKGIKFERLEGFDRLAFMVFEPEGVVGNATRLIDY